MHTCPKIHPSTGTRYDEPLWVSPSGRVFYPIGGAADDPPADPPQDPPADPPADPPEDPPTDPPADPPNDDTTDWKAEARKHEKRAKDHKATADTAAQQVKEFQDAIAKAIGLKDGDDNPDPTKLASDLTAAQQDARATKVENAVLRSAISEGASPDRLTDSRKFMAELETLDPAADDFTTKVADAIKAAVEADPTLKGDPPAPPRSGGPVGGGGDDGGEKSVEDFVTEFNKTK